LRSVLESGELSAQEYYQELMRLMYRFLFIITVEERNLIFEHKTEQIDKELYNKHSIYNKGYSLRRLRDRSARYATSSHVYGDLWEGIKIIFQLLGGTSNDTNNYLEPQPSAKHEGSPLDLPVLGGLFKADQCPHLDKCSLPNNSLLEAMHRLRWTIDGNTRTLIDYKNMGSEELGSVYESLLELVPCIDIPRRSFGFIGINIEGSSAGNTRKTTGSYYTNASLVECLIKSNLDPLIEEKLNDDAQPKQRTTNDNFTKEQKLLSITVIDPACGSGHFLLAAARRLADHLTFLRADSSAGDKQQIADIYRNSLRDVISSCIYGVDLNPLAVELARMALWLEGHEPDKPLSFLDHHIRCGNSLIGVMDFDVLNKGIPDDAYKALSGDDKECALYYKKKNKTERENKANTGMDLFEEPIRIDTLELIKFHLQLENIQNNNIDEVDEKQELFDKIHKSLEYNHLKNACDLYISAFFSIKKGKEPPVFSIVPTTIDMQRAGARLNESQFSIGVNVHSLQIAKENKFFHWQLEFPDIFQKGGFDCILGNPPWEQIQFEEEEYFATKNVEIANAINKAARTKLIKALPQGGKYEKQLYNDYIIAKRNTEAANTYAHVNDMEGGRFPLTGAGKLNTYALFAETILNIKFKKGRAGFIVPSGIATDEPTKNYFAHISTLHLVSLYSFENETFIFPDVHHSFKFSLISLGKKETTDLVFFLRNIKQLDDERRHFTLSRDEFILLNPNTQTCPIFRSKKDAELTKQIYRKVPVLIQEKGVSAAEFGYSNLNPWNIRIMRMFDMSARSNLFFNESDINRFPLYEGKMIHQFDHRWTTYSGSDDYVPVTQEQKMDVKYTITPRYWIDKNEVLKRMASDNNSQSLSKWFMGWRDITNPHTLRTVIVAIIPISGVANTMPLIIFNNEKNKELNPLLFANLNSIILDFVARYKIGGTHINSFVIMQFPVLPPNAYSKEDINFIVPRVLELTYTAVDLIPFAEDLWDSADVKMRMSFLQQRHGEKASAFEKFTMFNTAKLPENTRLRDFLPPFVFDPDRRSLLRAALDARYARLYGLTRDDLRYILDPADLMGADYPSETFRVLKEKEMAEYGEYRTRRLVLEAWDGEGEKK